MLNGVSSDLEELERSARLVDERESALKAARRQRDELIKRAVAGGATERQAAAAAGVAPSYAHRAAKHGRFASIARR